MSYADPSVEAVMAPSHEQLVAEATHMQKKAWPLMEKEWYPDYHVAACAGWLSVPGGLVFHDGLYHSFYQHNPYNENWGPMHWGHVTSPDLIHWQHQPVALAPGEEYDRDGCFSGSAVSCEGKLYIIYTGHRWGSSEDPAVDDIYQLQCLAVSEDGIHFDKLGPIVRPPVGFMHFRDPKVWFQHGRWWMVCGARNMAKDLGMLLMYTSEDLERWDDRTYTILDQTDDRNVFMWECPDFFPLKDEHVLTFCPQGKKSDGFQYRNRFQCGYLVGRWDGGKRFRETRRFKELDRGHDFYSPQTFLSPDGRRIIIGWMDMWESPMPTKLHGWSGVETLPRELVMDRVTGRVLMVPLAEYTLLRTAHASIPPQELLDNTQLPLVEDCTNYEVEVTFNLQNSTAEKYGLWLGTGAEFYVDDQSRRLVLNRHYPEHMVSGYRSCPLPNSALLTLRVFIDRSSMEVFVNGGEEVFSSRIYPAPGTRALRVFSLNGTASVVGGSVWQLDSTVSH